MMPAALALALLAQAATNTAPQVSAEQIQPATPSVSSDQIVLPAPKAPATSVDQIPADARLAPGATTTGPAAGPAEPPAGLPDEIRRAWTVLTVRRIAPTAEALMDYLGPEAMMRLYGQPALPASVIAQLNLGQ